MAAGSVSAWIRSPCESQRNVIGSNRRIYDHCSLSFRCKNPLYGGSFSSISSTDHDICLSKVWVAADYSDSIPDSSNCGESMGYHPLEDVKERKGKDKILTDAEIARTVAEANNKALLVFPGIVHREPHGHASWCDYHYVIDAYGDMYFEIYDYENIMQDREASNPVNVLIGLDIPIYKANKGLADDDYESPDIGSGDEIYFEDDDHEENDEVNVPASSTDWGYPDSMHWVHPMYFARHLTKAVDSKYGEMMDHPSNGISIVGLLRPALLDEEYYLRRFFYGEECDDHSSDWKDESDKELEQVTSTSDLTDGDFLRPNMKDNGSRFSSTLYKLEIVNIQLFNVYGNQRGVSLQDFQEAEPDILVHSASAIIDHFNEYGMKCTAALRTLCRKKKGMKVEGANIIGVDSLGLDVRVYSGVETKTLRFPFNSPATSESSAEKKIQRMLFPRHHRRNPKPPNDAYEDADSF
ncbi:unnamed protein product [Victoria cruziana]